MENKIVWIKEDCTDNIYCCEIIRAHVGQKDILYDVNCIIGSFIKIKIPRSCNLYGPSQCEMMSEYHMKNLGYFMQFERTYSYGKACYDIEKLK